MFKKISKSSLKKAYKDFMSRVAVEHPGKKETYRRYNGNVKAILNFFGEKILSDQINSEMVKKFRNYRAPHINPKTKRKLKPITVNHELLTLRIIFNRLVD